MDLKSRFKADLQMRRPFITKLTPRNKSSRARERRRAGDLIDQDAQKAPDAQF
jgi:hypothetical protein